MLWQLLEQEEWIPHIHWIWSLQIIKIKDHGIAICNDIEMKDPLGKSDHAVLKITCKINCHITDNNITEN